MAVQYHTHIFEIPTASTSEVAEGSEDGKAVTPAGLVSFVDGATAASVDITDDTQVLVSEVSGTNEKRTVVQLFNLGTVLDRNSVAHAEASTVDPLIKCLRTQFRDPDYAERATLVGGASYVRVNAEPTHAGKFRSIDRFTAEGDFDSDNGGWWELAERTVSPLMFGEIGAGDDTEAVRACHEYANLYRAAVSYAGIAEISVQSDAQILVNTDVDFGGCKLNIVGGIAVTPAFGTLRTAFLVADPDAPLVTDTASVTDGNLGEGSRTPTADFWTDPGFVYMQGADPLTSPLIANRDGTDTLTYRQSFRVKKQGRVVHGLARAMTGAGTVSYRARRDSAHGQLVIKNFRLDAAQFNNQIVIKVNRNQVRIEDVTIDYSATMPASINQLFVAADSSDFTLMGIKGPAQTSPGSDGTYVVALVNAAEVTFEKCEVVNGWGWQASENSNGVYLRASSVNRFDAHGGGFNLFAEDSDLYENGITFGWGGGALSVKGCRTYNCDVVSSRPDYGGYWFGSLVVEGITIDRDIGAIATVLNMETNQVGSPVLALPLFKSIKITGVHRGRNLAANSVYIAPIRIKVADAAMRPTAPETISIANITGAFGTGGWIFFNTIDLNNMVNTIRCLVTMDNVQASRTPAQSNLTLLQTAVGLPAKVGAHTSAELELRINNVNELALDLTAHAGLPRVTLKSSLVRRARNKDGGRMLVAGCDFYAPVLASGETTSIVGGVRASGSFNMTCIQSSSFNGTWDLSKADMLSGLMWPGSQDSNITLPGGATQATAMSGWRASF